LGDVDVPQRPLLRVDERVQVAGRAVSANTQTALRRYWYGSANMNVASAEYVNDVALPVAAVDTVTPFAAVAIPSGFPEPSPTANADSSRIPMLSPSSCAR
jgi:hypothetical protein